MLVVLTLGRIDSRKQDRVIPPELRDQWERDRAKKAERKRIRALARIQGAADLSRTRKSSRRVQQVFGGARFQGDTLYVEHISDMTALVEMIRTFVDNLETSKMVLPPKTKKWRQRAHLFAGAFHLKSVSAGNGDGRFMTLTKTTRTGVKVNERKVSFLITGNKGGGKTRSGANVNARKVSWLTNGNNGGGNTSEKGGSRVRPRDGEEVGMMAPRLSDSNVGFKLLQQMG